ncbi:hypothetical protein N474_11495 [Pseudoalteromonas luteoviolacea CPMOR-2]|uniref:Uncharacterized protein n=1 Tax=Pseudoalteromonas luteoviolacea DSM 6061 TaxID=1365250 RepID=A0A162A101_9GAMM|nr:hypothetical protein N475_01145 [Pseudoalteromonas luteoviolacea DSM 6061]KZN56362.1 hypothetical protein N474_11495 [Pseudoalteromonas luteoviolacea CPMOR-2]
MVILDANVLKSVVGGLHSTPGGPTPEEPSK